MQFIIAYTLSFFIHPHLYMLLIHVISHFQTYQFSSFHSKYHLTCNKQDSTIPTFARTGLFDSSIRSVYINEFKLTRHSMNQYIFSPQ